MRRQRKNIVLTMLVLATACAAVANAGAATAWQVPLTPANDGHDTVPVYVNMKGPYPFILDTGADGSAVYQWFADRAALPKGAKDEDLAGQTGSAKAAMYHIESLSLAGLYLRHVEAFGLPNRHDAGREAGILGDDFMDKAIVAFDFQCKRVDIYPKPVDVAAVVGRHAQSIKAGIDPGTTLLTLPVSVNGVAGVAILDTGSRNTRLTKSYARDAGIDTTRAPFHDDRPIYGTALIKQIPRTGPIGVVRIANTEFADATAQVVDLAVLAHDFGNRPAMLLGADLIGRYRLIYDHAAQTVWFQPSHCLAQ